MEVFKTYRMKFDRSCHERSERLDEYKKKKNFDQNFNSKLSEFLN